MNKLSEIRNKLKGVKNIEIIIAIAVIAVIILIYSAVSASAKKEDKQTTQESSVAQTSMTESVESSLEKTLSKINGVGKVEVMITYVGSTEKRVASSTSTHTSSTSGSGSSTNTSTTSTVSPVLVSGGDGTTPFVLEESLPEIVGVIVVAEGADSAKVRLDLMRAVQAALNINSGNIEIFAMNK